MATMSMPSPSRWRRIIGRALPWFNEAEWDRERAATASVLQTAKEAISRDDVVSRDDRMRAAYRQYADRLDRR